MPGKYKKLKVNGRCIDEHRYVMECHLGRRLSRHEVVHHINGDQRDNRLENLELTTLRDHAKMHKATLITGKRGNKNNNAKLTEEDIPIIRKLLASNMTCKEIGAKFGVAENTIGGIKQGRYWSTF